MGKIPIFSLNHKIPYRIIKLGSHGVSHSLLCLPTPRKLMLDAIAMNRRASVKFVPLQSIFPCLIIKKFFLL